jgi:inorganic pyrophosphatase
MASALDQIPFYDEENQYYHVIIETPKGSRNKLAYDEKLGLLKLKNVLPVGASFPFDFGFLPRTHGEDGDPVDVLVLMDEPVTAGCLVPARLIGVIAAEQTEDGNKVRNDRLLAVSAVSRTHGHLQDIKDLDKRLLEEIEHFFKSYNVIRQADFQVIGRFGSKKAQQLVAQAGKAFEQKAT